MTLKNISGNTDLVKQENFNSLGAKFETLTSNEKVKLGIRNGVKVTSIKDGKVKYAGIKDGFVIVKINDTRVSTEKDVERIYRDLTSVRIGDSEPVMFIVGLYPSGKTAYYAIDVTAAMKNKN